MTRPAPRPTLPMLALCAAAALAPRAAALEPPVPDLAAAVAAGPASTAAYGARCIGPAHDDTAAFQAAIDTGHTVYAPAIGGHCHITHPLVMRTPGQIFGGDGRARTRIEIEPGFTGEGVFVAETGEPGPMWRDFSVSFAQPDTDRRAELVRYPPAFAANATPRFQIEHVGCFAAAVCVDMVGNSGGAYIDDLQLSAFETGIRVDGSLDTVRLSRLHGFPFSLTPKQQALLDAVVWLDVGRIDGLLVTSSMFLSGTGANIHRSVSGEALATFESVGFDTSHLAVLMTAGNVNIRGGYFALGAQGSKAVDLRGGRLGITAATMGFNNGARSTSQAIISIDGADASFTFTNSNEVSCQVDMPFLNVARGRVLLSNNIFVQQATNADLRYAKVTVSENGEITAIGNRINKRDGHAGTMFFVKGDNNNRIIGNAAPSWTERFPPIPGRGIYQSN